VDLALTPAQLELQARAHAYVVDCLQPLEIEFEQAGGRCPRDLATPEAGAIDAGSTAGRFPRELGGQGWTALEQVVVHEQLGQATGGLWSFIPGAYNALVHADAEPAPRYLEPSLRGERFGSYAITEPAPAPTRGRSQATARPRPATGDYVLNGEKWFVTGPRTRPTS
jgi:alkylation response protein AidB-like acyl-CoA dehydrogenase